MPFLDGNYGNRRDVPDASIVDHDIQPIGWLQNDLDYASMTSAFDNAGT